MRSAPRHLNALIALFCAVVGGALIYVYYASPLEDRVENKLFDIRTRLSPNRAEARLVTLVTIDDETIKTLEPEGAKDLSFENLQELVNATLRSDARAVAVLIPPQVFGYKEAGLERLARTASADRRLILGTFDQSIREQPEDLLPPSLLTARGQVAKADIVRFFRREIVRNFVVRQERELPYLPWRLAEAVGPRHLVRAEKQRVQNEDEGRAFDRSAIKLNYFNPSLIPRVRAEDLLRDTSVDKIAKMLDGKVVMIVYTSFRPATVRAREATLVNSPWQADNSEVQGGISVLEVQAIAFVNLVTGDWLTPAPALLNLLQTLLLTLAVLASWRLSVGFASFLFIGGWSVLLIAHAAGFAFAGVYLPLADVALCTTLAVVAGALWRLRLEGRLRALQEARAGAEAELAGVQDRFLNRFAFELGGINQSTYALLVKHAELRTDTGTAGKAYMRALGSCEELDDYLRGIQHFASLRGKQLQRPTLVPLDVMDVIAKVVRQFDSRRLEARLSIDVRGPERSTNLRALADPTIVSQIIYNLVSNAVKYSPPNGTVRVRVSIRAGNVVVRVEDDGGGIAPEFQAKIFEKFYRVQDDHVYKLKGHGLGLYLSRYFAGQIDASIIVDSKPGRGAAFELSLRSTNA